jgi:diguanylate cyclase (GGDEF)-like protein
VSGFGTIERRRETQAGERSADSTNVAPHDLDPVPPIAHGEPPRDLRIFAIVAGDDEASNTRFADQLRASGLDVRTFTHASALLSEIDLLRPRLVVLHAKTVDRAGHTLCADIRATHRGSGIPILMIFGPDDETEIEQALRAGATDFTSFPLDPKRFMLRVRHVLGTQEALDRLRRNETRHLRVGRMARLASWELSLESDDFQCDAELLEMFACEPEDGNAQIARLVERVDPKDRERVHAAWESRSPHALEYRIALDASGATRVVQQEAELTQDASNGEVRLIGTVRDVTPLKEAERKISRLAYFDTLTGLPNRAFLREHLLRALAGAHRRRTRVGVMGIDLDLFKRINETLGHAAGDALLKVVAERLADVVRDEDSIFHANTLDLLEQRGTGNTVVRLGGDEFIVVLNNLRLAEDAGIVARRIAEKLAEGITIDGHEVFVGCSVGIALYPENGDTPEALLKHADVAMNHAKEKGRNNFQFFTEEINERAQRRMELEIGIRSGLQKDEFCVHYQPKVCLATGGFKGVEALVRWQHGDGTTPPSEFVPIAEDTGLIVPLGNFVMRTACAQAKKWLERGVEVRIAVNVSARQFREPNIVETIASILEETGLPTHQLEVEITEGVIMQDTATGISVLRRLKDLGVFVALDDFGTGYSSLSYLARFPIDGLKIDRTFVKDLPNVASCAAITTAIIALSQSLGLEVVAEGVETAEQASFLLRQGCILGQGWLYSKALPPDELEARFLHAFIP